MTEAEFIAAEQAKQDSKWLARLRRVERTGHTTRQQRDALLINDLIVFAGPRPEIGNPYNCFRLTENGRALLQRLEATA